MALSKFPKVKSLFSRLNPFVAFKKYSFVEKMTPVELPADMGGCSTSLVEVSTPDELSDDMGEVEISRCKKLNAQKFGVRKSMISPDAYRVVKSLQSEGFEAYLVGGCVRDLLLKRIPKDFDVITTAELDKVKKKFRRSIIVGKFPVCRVSFNDSVVEVTSFETEDKKSIRKKVQKSRMPAGCDESDFIRWKNSICRDFTINSLFYDPFRNTIFDYTDALMDLRSLRLKTIVPAISSFKEDQARILRGLRLAARLNLSFSKETEAAIYNLSSSVAEINKARLGLEINNMLSYGAAGPSLLLLKRFKLLEVLLPYQAAYLSEQLELDNQLDSSMLMKLFFNLDRLITCDRPCDASLWVAILSFHIALFNNPQPAIVVLTFASLLYHGAWDKSIKFARQHAPETRIYVPEISISYDSLSDDEIAQRVVQLAVQAKISINVFTDTDSLLGAMARFPGSPCSDMVFLSQKMGQKVAAIFKIAVKDGTSLKDEKRFQETNYARRGEGNRAEVRFVLGKTILDTLDPVRRKGIRLKIHDTQGNVCIAEEGTKMKIGNIREKGPIVERGSNMKIGDTGENGRIAERETKAGKVDMHENGPEQLLGILQQIRHQPRENGPIADRERIKVKKDETQEKAPTAERRVPKVKIGDTREVDLVVERWTKARKNEIHENGSEQLIDVLQHTPTDLRKGNMLPHNAAKAKIFRDNGIVVETRSSQKLGSENSDLCGHNWAPESKIDKAKDEVKRTVPSLSSLFK